MTKNNIKEIRKSRGLNKRELAKISGIGYDNLCFLERHRYDLFKSQIGTILKLCSALNCQPYELFNDNEISEKIKNWRV